MHSRIGFGLIFLIVLLFADRVSAQDGKILTPVDRERIQSETGSPEVHYGGFYSSRCDRNLLGLEREKPWMLPKASTIQQYEDTIKILAMRFDFQYEIPDDPSTTGRGQMDMRDTLTYFEDEGHMIDPSPHNRYYFEKHLEALNLYYNFISEHKLVLMYEVYPREINTVYHLPREMAHYGAGQTMDEVIANLVDSFFIDCFQYVDTTEDDITFADYDAYVLFHAGSDRQNDIGFPETQSDLFTGFARRGDDREPLYVDDGSYVITDAVIMPETACQDNRATALNAVMAHEFGHQLGLVDLYRTDNFFTQMGDFALMDNNGFGTGVDFGFERVGRAFGVMPVYPMAWSRAYLGFVEPTVFRKDADITMTAVEMIEEGIKIAKIPISEYEYYLLENRQIDIDGRGDPAVLADSVTGVILGPVYYNPADESKTYTHEYDFLLPGSGILIWHVDESVASIIPSGSSYTLFESNILQLDVEHRFVELMEADGLIDFGGNYYSGYGSQEDMYYAGNNSSFTPNTNPPSIGYSGRNSHIRITGISGLSTQMTFNLEFDMATDGFPRRAGYPVWGLSPVAADIDGDGYTEIMAASEQNFLVMRENGGSFFDRPSVEPYYDTTYSSLGVTVDSVPLFARLPQNISAGPVYGDFGIGTDTVIKFVSVGAGESLYVYSVVDEDMDGRGDPMFDPLELPGVTVWAAFDSLLYAAAWFPGDETYDPLITLFSINYTGNLVHLGSIEEDIPYGFARMNNVTMAIAGDSLETYVRLYLVKPGRVHGLNLEGFYNYGPVVLDLDRDDEQEIMVVSPNGMVKLVSIDADSDVQPFTAESSYMTDDSVFANPVVADIDNSGFAEIILCGRNKIHVLDRYFTELLDFPITIDKRYPNTVAVAPPVVADIDGDGRQDIVVIADNGNCYAFDPELLYGFPLSAGGIGVNYILLNDDIHDSNSQYKAVVNYGYGSPVLYPRYGGGGLGYLGGDGWFYSWDVMYDASLAHWPMNGGDASGMFNFPTDRLVDPIVYADRLPNRQFFCYPNPTEDGRTTIRYFLGAPAEVTLKFFDMVGRVVDERRLTGLGGVANEYSWNGSMLASGVYRCIIQADFGGETQTAFTDIAIVK